MNPRYKPKPTAVGPSMSFQAPVQGRDATEAANAKLEPTTRTTDHTADDTTAAVPVDASVTPVESR